ncbi:hypothetical protein IAG44_36855 [Streptomyces roseirectus]|uniref:Uncharacterized protein n=1 Tax=Streptomyces roseirectus TaxID=2768066 RepID=A0A7H0ITW9_9ACTN|nr:hypothetical protein [Streptomyces roseirectus]QNP76235.1 hypothetical protein IAG44_36855 [Streptomyces roseirectus]
MTPTPAPATLTAPSWASERPSAGRLIDVDLTRGPAVTGAAPAVLGYGGSAASAWWPDTWGVPSGDTPYVPLVLTGCLAAVDASPRFHRLGKANKPAALVR